MPVRDGPRTAASPLKSGHHVASPVPRKGKTPKETTQGGWEGARGTTEESTKTQNPFPPLCVHLCVGLPHRESCELFCGLTFSRRSFREEASLGTWSTTYARHSPGGASGKRPPWGPLNLKEPLQCGRPLGEFFVDIRPSITTVSFTMKLSTVTRARTCDL